MDLFKPGGIAKMALGRAVGMARGQVSDQIAGAIATAGEKKIDWSTYNWPVKHEYFGLLHFDLAELKEKRSESMYALIVLLHRWWLSMLGLMGLNFITTIVLLATVSKDSYSGFAMLYWVIEFALAASLGMFVVYKAYHGWAESSGRSKTWARGGMILLLLLLLIPIAVFGGNLNGLSGFGSRVFGEAVAAGTPSGVTAYWQAMIAVESVGWIAIEGWLGYCFYRVMTE